MIALKLREALARYQEQSGERLTYAVLAERAGLARATVESLASRPDYNTTLETIDRLCAALRCQPGDLLEHFQSDPER